MRNRLLLPAACALLTACALLLAACATPLAPTGGPEDRIPPTLVASSPAADAVNVATNTLELTFSEDVDPASVARALVLTPDAVPPPTVRVERRRVRVVWETALLPATTYVLTLGTELRDLRGVALPRPLTLAFATGPTLDRGALDGLLRDPATGRPVPGSDVFAYALPDSGDATPLPDPRTAPPTYRTQTGTDGRFAFRNLREAHYFLAAVQDRNRNRRADPGEAFAVAATPRHRALPLRPTPPPDDSLRPTPPDSLRATPPDSLAARPTPGPPPPTAPDAVSATAPDSVSQADAARPVVALWQAVRDTLAPEMRTARALTRGRVAVRFSEPVALLRRTPDAWTLEDTTRSLPVAVRAVWLEAADSRQVLLRTDSLDAAAGYRLTLTDTLALADSSGNAMRRTPLRLAGTATADTALVRLVGFLPERATVTADGVPARARLLRPDETPGFRLTQPPADTAFFRTALALTDTTGQPLPAAWRSADGLRFFLETPLAPGQYARLRIAWADTAATQDFAALPADARGDLVGRAVWADVPLGTILLEATPDGAPLPYRTRADSTGAFAFRGLPAGSYRLRLVGDRNGNGRWDGGQLAPFQPPEPLRFVEEPQRIRARWETEVTLTEDAP